MIPDEAYFDVTPKVVPADMVSQIRLRPRFAHAAFPGQDELHLELSSLSGRGDAVPVRSFHLENDSLVAEIFFTGEQEHVLHVTMGRQVAKENSSDWVSKGEKTLHFRFYSVNADLYSLRPYRGDLHVHSHLSDGKEAPEYVAARYRQAGFDFMAVTDHRRYAPSIRARDYWRFLKTGFRIYPGEEVHSPDNPVHIVNFGGAASVNDAAWSDEARYRREVATIQAGLPEGENDFAVAASEWVFERIRACGGLSLFCHPYWEQNYRYAVPEAVTDALLKRRKFDALEVVSGFYRHQWRSQLEQSARYFSECAKGNHMPVVGVSDSHGTDSGTLFDWFSTLVFSPGGELPDLLESIRSERSVAVLRIGEEFPNLVGNFRLVRYAAFLLDEYFPRHAELCAPEGALMLEYLQGSGRAREILPGMDDAVSLYRERFFRGGNV